MIPVLSSDHATVLDLLISKYNHDYYSMQYNVNINWNINLCNNYCK